MRSVGVTPLSTVLVTCVVFIKAMARDLSPYHRLVIGGICYSSCYDQVSSTFLEEIVILPNVSKLYITQILLTVVSG